MSRPSNYFPRIEIVSVFTWASRSTPQFRLQLVHAHLNVSIMCIISCPGHKSLSGELQSDFLHICWPNGRDEWRLWRIHNIPRGNRTNRTQTSGERARFQIVRAYENAIGRAARSSLYSGQYMFTLYYEWMLASYCVVYDNGILTMWLGESASTASLSR